MFSDPNVCAGSSAAAGTIYDEGLLLRVPPMCSEADCGYAILFGATVPPTRVQYVNKGSHVYHAKGLVEGSL